MLEKTNVPVTYSILHDIEYRNINTLTKTHEKGKRKAFTETNRRIQHKSRESVSFPFWLFFTE
jgi:hypothetical protein